MHNVRDADTDGHTLSVRSLPLSHSHSHCRDVHALTRTSRERARTHRHTGRVQRMYCITRTINDVQLCVLRKCEHQNLVHASTLFTYLPTLILCERIELEYQSNRVSASLRSFTKILYSARTHIAVHMVRNSGSSSSAAGVWSIARLLWCIWARHLLASSYEPAAISLLVLYYQNLNDSMMRIFILFSFTFFRAVLLIRSISSRIFFGCVCV